MRSLWRSQSHCAAHVVLCAVAGDPARKSWAVMSRFSMLRHGQRTLAYGIESFPLLSRLCGLSRVSASGDGTYLVMWLLACAYTPIYWLRAALRGGLAPCAKYDASTG